MCGWHRQYEWSERQWSAEGGDDSASPAAGADYRVSDAERDEALDLLRRHTAAGRLTVAEFEQRMDQALAARTASELHAALRELPPLRTARVRRPHASEPLRRVPLLALLVAVAGIGLAAGHLWILFPMMWLMFGVLQPWRGHRRGAGRA